MKVILPTGRYRVLCAELLGLKESSHLDLNSCFRFQIERSSFLASQSKMEDGTETLGQIISCSAPLVASTHREIYVQV